MVLSLLVAAGMLLAEAGPVDTLTVSGTRFDVDLYGNVVVLDGAQNMLRLLPHGGGREREVGGSGWLNDQFDRPAGLWARNGIDIYVADYGNHRIQRYDRSLSFVSSLSTRENDNADERFGYPMDVAMSRLGELYVVDGENARVVRVDNTSKVIGAFGDFRAGRGRLEQPTQVEVGPHDRVLVLDGTRLVVFDAFGNYLLDLLPQGLRAPSALFADDGCIAVADGDTLICFDGDLRVACVTPLDALIGGHGTTVRALSISAGRLIVLTDRGLLIGDDPRSLDKEQKNR